MDKLEKSTENDNPANTGFEADNWLSVSDVSRLMGKHEDSIREACAERNGKYRGGSYVFRKKGKRYEILLSSLPESIQAKYWLEHHKSRRSDQLIAQENQEILPLDHEGYEILTDSYNRKSESSKLEAHRRVLILDEYFALIRAGFKKILALNMLKERYQDLSRTTLFHWLKKIDKHPRHYWEFILVPDYQGRSKTEIPEIAWEHFCKYWLDLGKPDISVIYRDIVEQAKINNWGELPSCKTFARRIKERIPEK